VLVSVAHALNYYQRFRERELRASQLERNLTAAKLKTLQMQLNPHFPVQYTARHLCTDAQGL
jgi:LytS/YehU family sensor histidine kinase